MKVMKLTALCSALLLASVTWAQANTNESAGVYKKACTPELIQAAKSNADLCYGVNTASDIQITKKNDDKYKIKVVIIGESTNKNYMNTYGYPLENTPFLSSVNGRFFNNFISAASNTVPTLTRALAKNDLNTITQHHEKPYYNNNSVVDLANKAGYETYYIGNNGSFGDDEIGFTNYFLKANYFLPVRDSKPGFDNLFVQEKVVVDDSVNKLTNDFKMLPAFKAALNNPSEKEKVIFVHMWGPHHDGWPKGTCELVKNNYNINPEQFDTGWGSIANCYVSAIKLSDDFISDIYSVLQENNKNGDNPFSILYFSDHGQGLVKANKQHVKALEAEYKGYIKEGNLYLRHGQLVKGAYQVPLVVINSDDTKREFRDETLSEWNLFDYFASWLGVETNLTSPAKSIVAETITPEKDIDVFVFPRDEFVKYDSLPQDTVLSPATVNTQVVADN